MKLRTRIGAALAGTALVASGVVTAPTASAATCYQSMWRIGARHACVGYIQTLANYYNGGYAPLVSDNVFGPKTDRVVRWIQGRWGLKQDGIVGPQTWLLLCSTQMMEERYPWRVPSFFSISAARGAGCPGADKMYY
ncbi:MAG: peptidoglycan-binding protein [Dermatophilaceae bacterium]|nr:peptidoglycan-binding protein [Dermatophilaceae bacterium]